MVRDASCHVRQFIKGRQFIKEKELLLWAVALFLLLAVAYAFSIDIRASRGASISGDEPFYLLTTQSLLVDGDLDLQNQYDAKSYRSFFDHPDDLWYQSAPTPDGRILSPHNPGLSVLVILGFVLGGLRGVQVQLLLMAAVAMSLAFVLADRLAGFRAVCWVTTLGVGLTATAFIYSTEIYPEFPAALALVVALLIATRRDAPGWYDALYLAVALTAMCWLGTKYVALALPVAGYFLLRTDWHGRIALLAAGIPSAALFIWFHLHVFGGLTPYGVNVVYADWNTVQILGGHVEFNERYYRVWGLFVDRRFGLGRWAPLLLAVAPALALLARRAWEQRLLLTLIVVQLLIATFVAITMMGWWFPGRTMLTVLPLFVVPLALLIGRVSTGIRLVMALLGVCTLAFTAGLAHAGHVGEITIAVDPFDMTFVPFQAVAGLFPLYTLWTTETWQLTYAWWAAFVVTVAAVSWPESSGGCRRLLQKVLDAVGKRDSGLPPNERPGE